ncbi:MAG: MFS transporter [Clostridia bacterium]|nr:MFS transporter [Clostridia bacterium]
MSENQSKIDIERDVNIHLENKGISRTFFWFLWVMYAVVSMTKNCYNSSLASIVADGVLTKSQTGAITALFYLAYTPLQVVGGTCADKYSPEKLIKIGLIGATVSNTVIFFCQNYYVMLASWVFNGIIQFGIWPSIFKIVSSQLVRSDRSRMIFYLSFTSTAGFLISYLIGAVVSDWKYNFAISAISLLVFAVALHIAEKRVNPFMKWDKIETGSSSADKLEGRSKLQIFGASGFFVMLLMVVLVVTVSQSRSTLTSVMFVENYDNVSPSLGNVLTALLLVAGIVGNLVARKFVANSKNELLSLVLVYGAMLPFFVACIFVGKLPIAVMVAMFAVIACLEAVAALLRNYYTMYFTRYGLSGSAAGIINAGAAFSFMLAAYVMPRIIELFGWRVFMISLPVMIAVSIALILLIVKRFANFKSSAL